MSGARYGAQKVSTVLVVSNPGYHMFIVCVDLFLRVRRPLDGFRVRSSFYWPSPAASAALATTAGRPAS
eukprot:3025466-Pyramimonas_sp.AAC.1